MVGSGKNRKSMAYVGNLSAFLVESMGFESGTHLFNYVDKPDLSMQTLVETIFRTLDRAPMAAFHIPYAIGYVGGLACDLLSGITGKKLPISANRIRKFCSTTTFSSQRVQSTGFQSRICPIEALLKTIMHELSTGDILGRAPVD